MVNVRQAIVAKFYHQFSVKLLAKHAPDFTEGSHGILTTFLEQPLAKSIALPRSTRRPLSRQAPLFSCLCPLASDRLLLDLNDILLLNGILAVRRLCSN